MYKDTRTESKKEKIIIRNIIFSIIYILICGLIGFILGHFSSPFIGKDDSTFSFLFKLSCVILIFFVCFLIHVVIHEAGHLIFGLLTGYSFVSFRIGSYIIVKDEGKIKLKKYNLLGTLGQCLMAPPEMKNGKFPFILYNFGGVILNLITSALGLLAINYLSYPLDAVVIVFIVVGFLMALTNGIPFIPNDAYNILSIIKDKEAKKNFYLQLRLNALQTNGIRIKDIPFETLMVDENADLSNPLNTAQKLIEYNWYLDNLNFEMAEKTIESFKSYFNKIATIFKYEIKCERIFLELIGNCDKTLIDALFDKNLKRYIKKSKFMPNKKRLLMAYEVFYNNNKENAKKYYEELKQLANKYPIKGEADMELMLANWILEKK